MNKRLPLALLLAMVFMYVFNLYFGPEPKQATAPADGAPGLAADGSAPGAAGGGAAGGPPNGAGAAPGANAAGPSPGGFRSVSSAPLPGESPAESRPVAFEAEGFRAEFGTRGGALAWLELTGYHPAAEDDAPLRLVDGAVEAAAGAFAVTGDAAADAQAAADAAALERATALLVSDFGGRYPLERVAWEVSEARDAEGRQQIAFRWAAPDGLVFTRTVTDVGVPHAFELALEVANTGGHDAGGTLMLVLNGPDGLRDEQESSMLYGGASAVAVVGPEVHVPGGPETEVLTWSGDSLRSPPRAIASGEVVRGAGVMSNYFTVALAPRQGTYVQQVLPTAVPGLRAPLPSVQFLLTSTTPTPERPLRFAFLVYAGPKERTLAMRPELAPFLSPIVEQSHGSMAWINHGLLAVLRAFEWATGNWGVAIILLVVLVKVLLFPVNRVQQSSMQKYAAVMGRLKPELDALKAKHKNNKRKFGEEQMRLLKEHGATPPLGGCLLMFIQFPIWISLFQILRSSIELRHAPFALWIDDLSAPDRMPVPGLDFTLNLLPVLMAAATLVQMRMQPKTGDEAQLQMQKVMGTVMPVMMLFLLYAYPSGLSLYILVQSLLGIFEYRIIRKFWPVPGAVPAAESR